MGSIFTCALIHLWVLSVINSASASAVGLRLLVFSLQPSRFRLHRAHLENDDSQELSACPHLRSGTANAAFPSPLPLIWPHISSAAPAEVILQVKES